MYFFVSDNLYTITSTFHECETFLNLFFYTPERGIVNLQGFEFCRNQGLFWEPGVLQVFLNISFFLEAFVIKKSKLFLLFISFVILTSYSTTGLAILLIQALVYLSEERKNNKLILPVIAILLVPIYFVFSVNIDDKIQGDKEASFQKRIFDLTQPVFIAMENPLTGIGLDVFQFQKIISIIFSNFPKLCFLEISSFFQKFTRSSLRNSRIQIQFYLQNFYFKNNMFTGMKI